MKTKTKKERRNKLVDEKAKVLGDVWECSSGCFSKFFFARKCIKIIFFYFLKKFIFDFNMSKRSKNIKIIILSKKNSIFIKTLFGTQF
jgi:hypothetical protein